MKEVAMKWTNELREKWSDLCQARRQAHERGVTDHFIQKAWTEIVPNKTPIFDGKASQLNIGQRSTAALNKLAETQPKRKPLT
jgi:hypothetical protein